jgi:tuberculosinol/isotuberculosinol synthase
LFDEISRATAGHDRFHLFYGVFAHDATESIAEISLNYYQQHGTLPNKRQIVENYYGEEMPPVSLFIGFDRFSAFDMPLIATGSEDLYFTVSPSFYMSDLQLRRILYDHLFTRKTIEQDYEELPAAAIARMADFYHLNQHTTLGLGKLQDGFWYPDAKIIVPESFQTKGEDL